MASKKKPDDLPIGYFITLTAKYYFSDELNAEQLSGIIKEKTLEFDLDNYQNINITIKSRVLAKVYLLVLLTEDLKKENIYLYMIMRLKLSVHCLQTGRRN